MEKLKPRLRFQEYKEGWKNNKIKDIIERISDPVLVDEDHDYYQIGIRSHGKGIFHKVGVKGIDLGNKRVFWVHENCLIVNIVFAWEQAIAKTTQNEKGKIASHRFPMFVEKNELSNIDYLVHYFMTMKGKLLLEMASPGGAGRNKTLGQREFENLKLIAPSRKEQTKIASFLTTVDEKIAGLKKQLTLLERYKKGVMQKIFSQELRFQDENGNDFPDWEEKKLGEVCLEHKVKNSEKNIDEVFSVAKHKGVINQIEHLGRPYSANDISHYKIAFNGDLIYTKSPTSDFPFGIIKQNKTGRNGVVSPLYCVLKPLNFALGSILHEYFLSSINTYNYLAPLVQKGAKNTMNINNNDFLNGASIKLPVEEFEQQKIATFLSSIDDKLEKCQGQINAMENWKKGLLQQMFC